MNFEIRGLEPCYLFGISLEMSLQNNTTPLLWKNFMQMRASFATVLQSPLVSLQVYKSTEDVYSFDKTFVKWAGFFSADAESLPPQLEALEVPGGTYAVFKFEKGPAHAAAFFKEVFTQVLPGAGLRLDHRAHFEVLDANYRDNFKEEIWIPVSKA